jgi:hypothetical protein
VQGPPLCGPLEGKLVVKPVDWPAVIMQLPWSPWSPRRYQGHGLQCREWRAWSAEEEYGGEEEEEEGEAGDAGSGPEWVLHTTGGQVLEGRCWRAGA